MKTIKVQVSKTVEIEVTEEEYNKIHSEAYDPRQKDDPYCDMDTPEWLKGRIREKAGDYDWSYIPAGLWGFKGKYESNSKFTPCDCPDSDGHCHCPYEDFGGYESERCRVCCGLGVDEDDYDYNDYVDDYYNG